MPLCPEHGELLTRYAAGGAGPDEAARAEAHLERCAACREAIGRVRRVDELLRRDTAGLGEGHDRAGFTRRLKDRLKASLQGSGSGTDRREAGAPSTGSGSSPGGLAGSGVSKERARTILGRDKLVGQIALAEGMTTREDLREAVRELKASRASGGGPGRTLAQVLVRQRVLSRQQLRRIVAVAAARESGASNGSGEAPGSAATAASGEASTAPTAPSSSAGEASSGPTAPSPPTGEASSAPTAPSSGASSSAPAGSAGSGSGTSDAGGRPIPELPGDDSAVERGNALEEDVLVARLLAERELLESGELKELLGERRSGSIGMPLGQHLVKQRQLDIRDYLAVLQERKDRVVRCACGAWNVTDPARAGETAPCRSCGQAIEVPESAARWAGASSSMGAPAGVAHDAPLAGPDTLDLRQPGELPAEEAEEEDSIGTYEESSVPPGFQSGILFSQGDELRQFGPYEIVEEIARGGMGIVYKARQKDLNRLVALKILKEGEDASEKQIRRFRRETEAAAKLQHPNIVAVHEVGVYKGYHYFTMDLIEGKPLDEVVHEGSLSMEERLEILEEIGRAIDYAHDQGIVHRDLKPANIILDKLGHPKVTDFGLAKSIDSDSILTRTGAAVGTPFYMPPEQARGDMKAIDRRCDVYALGVIMYELMTGRLPFTGETTLEVYHKILDQEPTPPSKYEKGIDIDLETVCLKSMEKDVEHRYETARDLSRDIRHWLDGEPIEAKPVGRIGYLWRRMRRSWPEALAAGVAALIFFSSLVVLGSMYVNKRQAEWQTRLDNDLDAFRSRVGVVLREAESSLNMGIASANDRKYREAIDRFREAADRLRSLDELPDEILEHPDENEERAETHLAEQSGEVDALLRDLQFEEGNAHLVIGTDEALRRAVDRYDAAIELDPDFAKAYVRKAEVAVALGNLQEGIDLLTRAITIDRRFDEAYLARGEIYDRQEVHLEAIDDYTVVVDRYQDAPPASDEQVQEERRQTLVEALLARAASHLATGLEDHVPAAETDVAYVIQDTENGFDNFEAHLLKGQIHEARGDLDGAAAEYRQGIDLKFSRPQGYYRLGMLFLRQRRHEEAISNFEKAVERDPDHYPSHLAMGAARAARLEYPRAVESLQRIIRSPRREARDLLGDAYHRLGVIRRVQGETEEALDAFDRAIEADGRHVDARVDRALLRARAGNVEGARADLDEAEEVRRFDPRIAHVRGRVEMAAGTPEALERAREHLSEAQRAESQSAPFNAHLGALYRERGERGRARTFFVQALEIERRALEDDREPTSDAVFFYREGARELEEARSSGKPEAIEACAGYFRRAIDRAPRYAHAHLGLGRILELRGRAEGALEAFRRATEVNPYLGEGWVALGNLLREEGSIEESVAAFDEAISLDPSDAEAFHGRARAHRAAGDLARALDDLAEATYADPDHAAAYSLLAEVHEERGDPEAAATARSEHDRIIEERRERAREHLARGRRLEDDKRYTEAIAAYEQAVDLDPQLHEAYYQRGLSKIKIGDLISAVLDFSRALELEPAYVDEFYDKVYRVSFVMDLSHIMAGINDLVESHPDDAHVVFLRGFFYVAKVEFQRNQPGDEQRGIDDFDTTLEINPDHVAAYLFRGFLHMRMDHLDQAMADFDRVVELEESLGAVHYFRASCHAKMGEPDAAFEELDEAFFYGFNGYDRIRQNEAFEPYREDERYIAIMEDDPGGDTGIPGLGGGLEGLGEGGEQGLDPSRLRDLMDDEDEGQ